MFSVITNIYNKKTKGPTLMEFFTITGKRKKFFFWQLEMFDLCTTGPRVTRHTIQILATHASTCWRVCGKNLNILSLCAVHRGAHIEHL